MKRTTNLPTGLAALPPKVRARLENPPNPGTGVHPWIFSCALAMLRFLPEADATDLLKECLPRDPSPANEVERQVQAAAHIIESGQTGTRGRRRPEFPMHLGSPAKVLELAEGRINLDCLRSLSPVAKTAEIPTVDVLRALFPDNPLICAGQFFHRALTQPLNDFHPRFLSRCSFVVPNPMSALTGFTQFGDESRRCGTNVGPRRFGVVEADVKVTNPLWVPVLEEATAKGITAKDLGAAILLSVSDETGIPLTAAVHSGGVSIHGWFYLEGTSFGYQRRFYETAARLGGDPATCELHQWIRMPNGTRWREDEFKSKPAEELAPQRLEYFDPNYLNHKQDNEQ